jgi:protease I
MTTILMPISDTDFEPSETSIPLKILKDNNINVVFATPDGRPGKVDYRIVTGKGLGIWKMVLMANKDTLSCYSLMLRSKEFNNPIKYTDIDPDDYSGILLSGGHAPGMKTYLESKKLQDTIVSFFKENKPVGAICHGVLLAARSINPETGKSVLYDYKTTALLKSQELIAYYLTCLWLKRYYRTYPLTVEDEVKTFLADKKNFIRGNLGLFRDSAESQWHGFTVRDRNYLSSRWPGDVHRFSFDFLQLIR